MKERIGTVIAFGLVLLFLLGAHFDFLQFIDLSTPSSVALGILLAAATLWITEAIPLFVTSLLVLFLCITWLVPVMEQSGLEVDKNVFLQQYFSDLILLFLGGFVLSAALHKQLIDEWLARSIISRTGGSIPLLILSVMGVTALLSMWLSNTATAAMMLALVIPIAERLPAGDRYRQGLILAVPFAANIGGLGTPIGSPPNAIAMQYMQRAQIDPGFAKWMLIGVPGVLVMIGIAWLVLMLFFRGQATTIPEDEQPQSLDRSRSFYVVAMTAAVTVLGWMTSGLHGLSTGTVALIPVLVLFSTGILSVKDLRSLSWDVLLLMGGGLCLGTAISESGLATRLIALLPVEGLGEFGLMIAFGTLACTMSSIMSNTATANLIMPIILGLSVSSLSPLLVGTAFACTLAMPLPVSTPPNAMAFSSGQVSVGAMIRAGLLITLVGICLAFTTGYWWWKLVGLEG